MSIISSIKIVDKMDIEVLRILQEDSSIPFVEVAERLGVTDGTIHQRIKKLKRSGVLKRFTIQVDQEKIGYGSLAYLLVKVTPGFIDSVSSEISRLPHVLEVHEVHTQGDILVKIRAPSQEEIRNIIVDKIRRIEGVSDSDLFPVYKKWKEENMMRFQS